jgi:hypothetical protein
VSHEPVQLVCPECGNKSNPQPLPVPVHCTRFAQHRRKKSVEMKETPK